jgi:hypothetical protein
LFPGTISALTTNRNNDLRVVGKLQLIALYRFAVVDDRTIQVASGFADLETDTRRQAGFRVWTQVLSGERDTERDED